MGNKKDRNWRRNLRWPWIILFLLAVALLGALWYGVTNECGNCDHGRKIVPVPVTPVVTPVTPVATETVTPIPTSTNAQPSSLQIVGTATWQNCMDLLRAAFPNASQRGVEGSVPYEVPTVDSLESFLAGCNLGSEKDVLACFEGKNVAVGFAKQSDGEFATIFVAEGGLYKAVGANLVSISPSTGVIFAILY